MKVAKAHHPTLTIAVTVSDAARATRLSENYLRLLISRGQLAHVRVGRAVRVMVSDIDAFLQQHRQEATSFNPRENE